MLLMLSIILCLNDLKEYHEYMLLLSFITCWYYALLLKVIAGFNYVHLLKLHILQHIYVYNLLESVCNCHYDSDLNPPICNGNFSIALFFHLGKISHKLQCTQAAVFHYGSIGLIAEPCRSAHLRAMEIAKEAGALLSYDPNLREALWPSREVARTQILSIWDQADIVKVSEVELEFLTGIASVEDDVVMKLWRPTMQLLLVTLGDQGCKYYARDFHGVVPSYMVQQVDTTGAGDAFVGALLRKIVQDPSSLQDQKRLEEAIKFANACGAITTTKKGAIPSLPTEIEVLQLMKSA